MQYPGHFTLKKFMLITFLKKNVGISSKFACIAFVIYVYVYFNVLTATFIVSLLCLETHRNVKRRSQWRRRLLIYRSFLIIFRIWLNMLVLFNVDNSVLFVCYFCMSDRRYFLTAILRNAFVFWVCLNVPCFTPFAILRRNVLILALFYTHQHTHAHAHTLNIS